MKSVKRMFVYGTLMSGERNHRYFKDSVLQIEEAYVNGTVYDIKKQKCPAIELGSGRCHGELITYVDPNNKITESIVALEQSFDGLEYTQQSTVALVNEKPIVVQVFCYPLSTKDKLNAVNGRWSEHS